MDNEMKAADTRRLEHVWKPAYHDLEACTVCDSFEGATTTECPGRRMTQTEIDAVYAGELDYRRIGFSSGTFRFGWVIGFATRDEVRAAAEKTKAAFEYAFKNSRAQLGLSPELMASFAHYDVNPPKPRHTPLDDDQLADEFQRRLKAGKRLDVPIGFITTEPATDAITYEDPEISKPRTCYLCGRVQRRFRTLNPPICTDCRT